MDSAGGHAQALLLLPWPFFQESKLPGPLHAELPGPLHAVTAAAVAAAHIVGARPCKHRGYNLVTV